MKLKLIDFANVIFDDSLEGPDEDLIRGVTNLGLIFKQILADPKIPSNIWPFYYQWYISSLYLKLIITFLYFK